MNQATLSRRQFRKRHVREKAVIDHLVRAVFRRASEVGRVHEPFTLSGLSVEDQLRKVWHPSPIGLAMF